MTERTEVQRVYIQDVKEPWLLPVQCRGLDGKGYVKGFFIFFRQFPNQELVILAVPIRNISNLIYDMRNEE